MNLIENKWDESLLNLSYYDGYDNRLHGVQTALSLLSRRSSSIAPSMNDPIFTTVKFGYYDVETEDAIKSFQSAMGYVPSGLLDEVTYRSIFSLVKGELNASILLGKNNTICIKEVTSSDIDVPSEGNEHSYDNIFGNPNSFVDIQQDVYEQYKDSFSNKNAEIYIDNYWNSMTGNNDDLELLYYAKVGAPTYGSGGVISSSSSSGGNSNQGASSGNDNDNDDSNYIDTLVSNSIYNEDISSQKSNLWVSNSSTNINVNGYMYDTSDKYDTFFGSDSLSPTRRSNYDITIVYGANGQFAKRLVGVVHRSRSQQLDASGEALFDVIEFIAKDVVETDNVKLQFA